MWGNMGELPTDFEFGEYLSHTFPGFFSAVTFFMLLDIWSPQNLTAWAIKDISGLISFTAFILLAGTILGVILDGIRHSLVEDIVFSNLPGYIKIKDHLKSIMPGDELELGNYYFLNTIGKNPAESQTSFELLVKNVYRYVEFYGNTSISLVMFSFVIPFYLYQVLFVPWNYSFLLAIFSLIISCFCLYSCYEALKSYQKGRFSQICGYLDQKVKISYKLNEPGCPTQPDAYEINATIVDKKCLNQVAKEDMKITLKTSSGSFHKDKIVNEIIEPTEPDGKITKTLYLNNNITEVTASSENCIPAVIKIRRKNNE